MRFGERPGHLRLVRVIGFDRTQGVVDDTARVFDASSSDSQAVHKGLYVCDGSIIPRPLGVNPLAHRKGGSYGDACAR